MSPGPLTSRQHGGHGFGPRFTVTVLAGSPHPFATATSVAAALIPTSASASQSETTARSPSIPATA